MTNLVQQQNVVYTVRKGTIKRNSIINFSTEPIGNGADDNVMSDNMDAAICGTESGLHRNIPSLRRT